MFRAATALICLLAMTIRPPEILAQSAPPATGQETAEAVELPAIEVEATTAKRNRRKAQLRRSAPAAQGAPASSIAVTAEPVAASQTVIEGEKVTRTIKDTTTSVGVVTSQDIKDRQLRDVKEAIEQTANVVTSEKNSGFSIRGLYSEGMTNTQHISAVPLIGVTIDGATQNPDAVRRGARSLWDVEQVEVLRGPQSTLQGRNALGGALVVKTNDPTYDLSALIEGTAGTNGLKAGGFVLNAPIVGGQSAFRISGYKTERERGIDYADPENEEMDDDRFSSLRGKLLIEPDSLPGLSALFTASRAVDDPGTSAVSGPDFKRAYVYPSSLTDFRETSADNYISDISYELTSGLTLRSVSAYANTRTLIRTPVDAAFIRNGDNILGEDITQDVRLEINNRGNGLSGVAGLFYGYFERDAFTNSTLDVPFLAALPSVRRFAHLLPNEIIQYQSSNNSSETTSMAAYADLRFRWDRWALLGGGRLLRDEVKTDEKGAALNVTNYIRNEIFGLPVDPYDRTEGVTKQTFDEFLPKLGLTYDLTDNQTVGATYSKGYRTGFQQITTSLTRGVSRSTVDPEFLKVYELSYRSNWFANTFDLNANVFYYDYQDQQVAVLNPFFGVTEISNAGNSHAYGSEIEARWRPTPHLQLFAALGLMQSEFDELKTRDGDFAGNEFAQAPAYNLSAGAMYRSPTGWFVGANVRHTDGYYSAGGVANSPTQYVDSYTVVDASVGWEWEHYTLTLFAKNLLDEDYLTAVDRTHAPPQSPAYGSIGDERLVGVTLTSRF